MSTAKPVRGFLFACTNQSEEECLNKLLFATGRSYGPVVIRIREGDLIFLNNIDTDTLFGVFKAVSDGSFNLEPTAFDGRYPYQLRVQPLGEKIAVPKAKKLLNRFGVKRNIPLFGKKLMDFLDVFLSTQKEPLYPADEIAYPLVREQIQIIKANKSISKPM